MKNVRLILLGLWGFASFILVCCEGATLLPQLFGILSLIICCCVGSILRKKGSLPKIDNSL